MLPHKRWAPLTDEGTSAARESRRGLSRWLCLKNDHLPLAVDPDLPRIHSPSSSAPPSALFKALMAKKMNSGPPQSLPDKEDGPGTVWSPRATLGHTGFLAFPESHLS